MIYKVILRFILKSKDVMVTARREIALPYVPYPGIMLNGPGWTFMLKDLTWDIDGSRFVAHQSQEVEAEAMSDLISTWSQLGWEIERPIQIGTHESVKR